MKNSLVVLLLSLFVSLNLSARVTLSLHRSAMQVGGGIQMPISIPKNGQTVVGMHVAPSWDYFLAKSFSLGMSPSIERESVTGKDIPWKFSIAARGTYYFDLGGALYPYLGAGAGIGWATKVDQTNYMINTPVGMLVAINSRVGLDFGVPVAFIFDSEGYLGTDIPLGYLGVRAFF